ncbi:MAG: peptidylprolyl isomerase [Candidatus Eisenbacteria bacterium]|nr:peptidylprolyl isomerase [Candidatus Eisenbacteria bacterium]
MLIHRTKGPAPAVTKRPTSTWGTSTRGRSTRWASRRAATFTLLLALAGLGANLRGAAAQAGAPVEEIAAVVGDKPILRSQVEEQFQALAPQLKVDPADTASVNSLRRDILSRLVDDQVLVLEAKTLAIEVSEEEVRQQVAEAIQNNVEQLGGQAAFQEQLKREGLSQTELESRYGEEARKQMLAQRLIQREVRPKVSLSDADVQKFFAENRDQLPKKPRSLHLFDLFIMVRADSILDLRARERAAEARKAVLGGLAFAEAAKKHSDAPDAAEGGTLGRFTPDDLDGDFERAAFGVPVGQTSEPVRSRYGWHILKVKDRDPAGAWVELEHILAEVTPTRSDVNRTVDRAASLRSEMQGGKLTFEDAVRRYSDDEESRARDGDLGWIPMTGFAGAVKEVVDTLRVGRLSQPVASDGGVHVFKLVGEEAEGSYAFDDVKEELRQMAGQQALERGLQEYLVKLREKYFVEIRAQF